MVFKLVITASKTWRRLKGENQVPKVIGGVRFQDGIEVIDVPAGRPYRDHGLLHARN
jgi:putative transposase